MSDTPRTDAAYFASGATMYDLAGEMKKLERELNEAKASASALAYAIEYTLKADTILHPETDHVGMRQALETYRNKYKEGKQ